MQMAGMLDRNPISRLTLQVTDSCNLRCSYCFTGDKKCTDTFVSEEDFGCFLGFCLRNGMRGIRLTGGETMLHPHIHRFVRLATQVGMSVHIFSNFTVKNSLAGLYVPGKALSFLVNINDRATYSDAVWDNLNGNLALAKSCGYATVLGYTVHSAPFAIPHILRLASDYGVAKIRISPAKPTIGAGNRWLHRDQMRAFAESTLRLFQELQAVGRKIVLDCPIPFCHLPNEYLQFFAQELKLIGVCGFGTSVNVKLEVGHCYVTNSLLSKRSLRSFTDAIEIAAYMRRLVTELDTLCPHLGECRDCGYRKQGVCEGGCYGVRYKSGSERDGDNG